MWCTRLESDDNDTALFSRRTLFEVGTLLYYYEFRRETSTSPSLSH